MKYLFSLTFLLGFILLCGCSTKSESLPIHSINANKAIEIAELDSFLKGAMDSLKIPGLSFAIINDSQVVFHRAIGVTNNETNAPVNDSTMFESASITKPVFAYFALKMAEKSIINLDRPLFYYVLDEEMSKDDRYYSANTRMVLGHTTGFPNWRWFDPAPEELNIPRGEFYMKADPGTFTYSGEAYSYLARVLARNNHVNMYELADIFYSEVTRPLGMKHAYIAWDDFLYDNKAFGHKQNKMDGRLYGPATPGGHSKMLGAAGGLHTEAKDYSKFLIALLDRKGLYPSSFDDMFAEHTVLPDDHRWRIERNTKAWGLGLAIEEQNGNTYYKHGGNNGGFTSGFLINPDTKNGYVFFVNCDKGDEFDKRIRAFLL